jgi:hypothetical protein
MKTIPISIPKALLSPSQEISVIEIVDRRRELIIVVVAIDTIEREIAGDPATWSVCPVSYLLTIHLPTLNRPTRERWTTVSQPTKATLERIFLLGLPRFSGI